MPVNLFNRPEYFTDKSVEFCVFFIGVAVRVSGEDDKLMHNKFCLIDGTASRGILITGSMNWTYGVSLVFRV